MGYGHSCEVASDFPTHNQTRRCDTDRLHLCLFFLLFFYFCRPRCGYRDVVSAGSELCTEHMRINPDNRRSREVILLIAR